LSSRLRVKTHPIMAHLTEQLRYGLLARSLSPAETVTAVEHIQICASCRDDVVALRSSKPDSLFDQILPPEPNESHPSDDLLAAYVDNVLPTQKKAFSLHSLGDALVSLFSVVSSARGSSDFRPIEDHLKGCDLCAEIIADLMAFKNELHQLPAKKRTRRLQSTLRTRWERITPFAKPLILGGAFAAVLVIIAGLVSTRLLYRSPASAELAVDTIRDGAFTFSLAANGQLVLPSAALPDNAVTVLANSIGELVRSRSRSSDLMRGLSETPGAATGSSSEEAKLPSGDYFFSRRIFGAVVALPRATPDPDVQPNGIVINDTIPVLSWSSRSHASASQTLTVRDCATNQTIVETKVPGDKHSFAMPGSLQHGSFYLWEVIENKDEGARPAKSASGRFKIVSESDLGALSSPAAQSSHLLKAFLLARAGLFAEADAELTKLAESNPKSPTIAAALNYVRELEGM
jgi:hypothetical protein